MHAILRLSDGYFTGIYARVCEVDCHMTVPFAGASGRHATLPVRRTIPSHKTFVDKWARSPTMRRAVLVAICARVTRQGLDFCRSGRQWQYYCSFGFTRSVSPIRMRSPVSPFN